MSNFSIIPDNLRIPIAQFGESSKNLHHYAGEIDNVKNGLNSGLGEMVPVLDALKLRTLDHSTGVQTLGVVLGAVVKEYKDHEEKVFSNTLANKSGSNPFKVMSASCVVAAADGGGGGGSTVSAPKGPWDDIDDNDPRKKVWNNLPDELKKLLGPDDIMVADDGYFIIKCSLVDLLKRAGADEETLKLFDGGYDDWYVSGIMDENGEMTYSMFKFRPLCDPQTKGTSIPYMSFDMRTFAGFLGNDDKKPSAQDLKTVVDYLVYSSKHQSAFNEKMLAYFQDTNSDGSYLIADFISERAAEQLPFDDNHQYKLPYKYGQFDDYSQAQLDKYAELGLYDKKNGTIKIDTSDGLSEDEKGLLLLVSTGDPDKYAFAAENEWHADKYSREAARNGDADHFDNGHCIAADMNVETDWWERFKKSFYEGEFKSEYSKKYRDQKKAHGGN